MIILAIDPGPVESAWVKFNTSTRLPVKFAKEPNDLVFSQISTTWGGTIDRLAIEQIASYGMAVGESVFTTCIWVGRYMQHWIDEKRGDGNIRLIKRAEVKMHLCHSMKAKDSNIRQAIMDMYGSTKDAAIGKKAKPGPLFGVSSDVWAALGVAITCADTKTGAEHAPDIVG